MQAKESSTKIIHCLENYNINNFTNNSISIPISIPRTNSSTSDLNYAEQYSLNSNIFDPSKMSPPNYWKCRLEKRIKNYKSDSNISINE